MKPNDGTLKGEERAFAVGRRTLAGGQRPRYESKMAGRLSALSVVSTLLLFSPAVVAVPAPAAVAPQDEAAQQAFRAGVDFARQENWEEARTAFERAYSLSPRPVVLINLAGAQVRTGRLTEAAKNYQRILEDENGPETSSFRRAAGDVLPELEARIPRVRLRPSGLSPADAIQIDGDGVEMETLAAGHPLNPGEHTLVVKHDGAERARVLFTLVEREQREITLPLPAIISSPRPVSPPMVEGSRDQVPAPGDGGESSRVWWKSPWTWTAVAVVLAGATATALILYERRDQPIVGNIEPGTVSVR